MPERGTAGNAMDVVLRQGTEFQEWLTQLAVDVSTGLAAANAQGITTGMPAFFDVTVTLLVEGEALSVTDSQVTPEVTETQSQVNPEVVSTSRQDHSAAQNTTRPANQRTTSRQSGGDRDEQNNYYGTGTQSA